MKNQSSQNLKKFLSKKRKNAILISKLHQGVTDKNRNYKNIPINFFKNLKLIKVPHLALDLHHLAPYLRQVLLKFQLRLKTKILTK